MSCTSPWLKLFSLWDVLLPQTPLCRDAPDTLARISSSDKNEKLVQSASSPGTLWLVPACSTQTCRPSLLSAAENWHWLWWKRQHVGGVHPIRLSCTSVLLLVTVVGRKLLVAKVFTKLCTMANEPSLAFMEKTSTASLIIQKLLRLSWQWGLTLPFPLSFTGSYPANRARILSRREGEAQCTILCSAPIAGIVVCDKVGGELFLLSTTSVTCWDLCVELVSLR